VTTLEGRPGAPTYDDTADRQPRPVRRCGHDHHSFEILAEHVVADFPQVPAEQAAQELRIAREAVALVDIGTDALAVAEVIARYRLLLRCGAIDDIARLDPQSHPNRHRTRTRGTGPDEA
jgi:hypothetical protein